MNTCFPKVAILLMEDFNAKIPQNQPRDELQREKEKALGIPCQVLERHQGDRRGRELVLLLDSLNLTIINGRCVGDSRHSTPLIMEGCPH